MVVAKALSKVWQLSVVANPCTAGFQSGLQCRSGLLSPSSLEHHAQAVEHPHVDRNGRTHALCDHAEVFELGQRAIQ
jgi:hypothetical protein